MAACVGKLVAIAVLIVIPAFAQTTAERPAPLGTLVDVGGYRVHLYCTGSGSPTVLVVGAGFSVDWALVQADVAKFTTICTYDVSGTAWSDPGPELTCGLRVAEAHKLVRAAHLQIPLVMAGLSIGACVARLYAAEYPAEISGMVIVDHAFAPDIDPAATEHPRSMKDVDTPPMLISSSPITLTTEQMSNFSNLPERMQELHRWAMSLHPKLQTWDTVEDCLAQLRVAAAGPFPLGDKPLVVVSTGNQSPGYDRLQASLLALSRHSTQMKAEKSFHSVEIDQPDVVAAAMRRVVEDVRRITGR